MEPIPFRSLSPQYDRIRDELGMCFKNVIDRGRFILDTSVQAFESEYAAYSRVKHCIGVGNGLDALFISLKVLGVQEGDEVLVPALTCAPTWMGAGRSGATLVPVDADPYTFNMSVAACEAAISSRTKAIVPVHLYGNPADVISIRKLADAKNIYLVEDNAQGHGASIQGKKTGSFGIMNATSFYPTKNLAALGDGGAITTDDSLLAEKAKSIRNYGSSKRFIHETIGINSRLDEVQAAFLSIKLAHLDEWNDERRKYAVLFRELLTGVGDLGMPKNLAGAASAFHLFVITTGKRDDLRDFLKMRGIDTDIHYPVPPHFQDSYKWMGFRRGSFPVAEKLCGMLLSLPLWPGMGEDKVVYVSRCVRKFFDQPYTIT